MNTTEAAIPGPVVRRAFALDADFGVGAAGEGGTLFILPLVNTSFDRACSLDEVWLAQFEPADKVRCNLAIIANAEALNASCLKSLAERLLARFEAVAVGNLETGCTVIEARATALLAIADRVEPDEMQDLSKTK